jgi:hypothetical protein
MVARGDAGLVAACGKVAKQGLASSVGGGGGGAGAISGRMSELLKYRIVRCIRIFALLAIQLKYIHLYYFVTRGI